MAGAVEDGEAEEAFSVATWRIVTLFLLILAVDAIVELVDELVTHHLKRNPESAQAWAQLKFETMALGVVSLLLVVFEEHLLKICINSPEDSEYESDAEYAKAPESSEEIADAAHRRLLAGGGEDPCPDGKESLWSSALIHKAHILIFLIAACHLIWAMLSTVLSVLALRSWHQYEARMKTKGLLPMPVGGLQREGEPVVFYGVRQCLRQFTHPVNEAQFGAIRALFIEFTKSEEDFDFAGFVSSLLTAEFATVVKFDVFMWGLVVIWLLFPEGSYGGLWLTGAFIVLALIAGAKLHIIAMHLSRHAYSRFYRPYSRKPSKLELTNVSESNVRDSPTSHKHAAGPVAEGVEGQGDGPDKTSDAEGTLVAPEAASSTRVPLRRLVRGHSQRIKGTAEDEDLFKLFWFRTPRHMLRIFRYAFFQSALGVAAIIFRFWQNENNFLGGPPRDYGATVRAIGWLFFGLVILLLVHISMYLLPVYALTSASIMFSNIDGVLKCAKQSNIRLDLVDFLEKTAPRRHDEEDDEEEVAHAVASCAAETAHPATDSTAGGLPHTTPPDAPSNDAAQGSVGADRVFTGDNSTPAGAASGAAAVTKSASPSPTEVPAVAGAETGSDKVSVDAGAGAQGALGVRAAAEMPTSGGQGGGEVDWFDQMEREQGALLGPGVPAVPPERNAKQSTQLKAAAAATPVATPTAGAAAVEVRLESSDPQNELLGSKDDTPVAVLAAAEMPLSGVGGDAAVDWLDTLEREQGEVGSGGQTADPLRNRGSRNSPAQFKNATGSRIGRSSIARAGSGGAQLENGGGSAGEKSFAHVMRGSRAVPSMDSLPSLEDKVRSRRGSTHSAGKDPAGALAASAEHAHGHHEPRPPTLTDTVSKLLESMATQRHAELTRRLTRHGP